MATTANSPRTARTAAARRPKPAGATAAAKLAEPPEVAVEAPEPPSPPALERYRAMDVAVLADHPEWLHVFKDPWPVTSLPLIISDEQYAAAQNYRSRLRRGDLSGTALSRLVAKWHAEARAKVHRPRPPFVRVPVDALAPSAGPADHAPGPALESPPESTEGALEPLPEETP